MAFGIIEKSLRQVCVYWPKPSPDGRGANQTDAPVEIKCRWTASRQKMGRITSSVGTSNTQSEEAIGVFVDRDVEVGGFLWYGFLATLATNKTLDPGSVDGVFEIRSFAKVPTPKADKFLRVATI